MKKFGEMGESPEAGGNTEQYINPEKLLTKIGDIADEKAELDKKSAQLRERGAAMEDDLKKKGFAVFIGTSSQYFDINFLKGLWDIGLDTSSLEEKLTGMKDDICRQIISRGGMPGEDDQTMENICVITREDVMQFLKENGFEKFQSHLWVRNSLPEYPGRLSPLETNKGYSFIENDADESMVFIREDYFCTQKIHLMHRVKDGLQHICDEQGNPLISGGFSFSKAGEVHFSDGNQGRIQVRNSADEPWQVFVFPAMELREVPPSAESEN